MAEKVVAVTGCDSGFGKEAALRFAKAGYCVVAGCLTQAGIDSFTKKDGEINGVKLDVTDDASAKAFGEEVKKICKGRPLVGLVNNAGVAPTGYVEWAPLSDLQKAMDINVYGQIRVSKACVPILREARGRVVNVSSICGRLAFGGAPWYSCTKFAVEGWTDSFRREMAPFGIHVAIVEPGFFRTNMVNVEQYAVQLKKQWSDLPDEAKKAYGEQTLTGYIQNINDQVEMMADSDTSKVVEAMFQAVTSARPLARYSVGGSANYFFLPISYLPTWLADGILAGINQKYKPDGKIKAAVERFDLVALWMLLLPVAYYGMTLGGFSRSGAMGSAVAAALYITRLLF